MEETEHSNRIGINPGNLIEDEYKTKRDTLMKYIFLFFFLIGFAPAISADNATSKGYEGEVSIQRQTSLTEDSSLMEISNKDKKEESSLEYTANHGSYPAGKERLASSKSEQEEGIDISEFSPYLSHRKKLDSLKAFWKTAFKPKVFYGENNTTGAVIVMEIYSKLSWELIETLSIHAQGLIVGRSGFTQFIYDRQDRASGSYLQEGFFKWDPYSYFSLKFGIIEQSFLKAPLLITDKAFSSFQGEFLLDDLFFPSKLSVLLQMAIPTNAAEIIQRQYQFIKGYPLFLSSSAFLNMDDFFLGGDITENFTFFAYYNLPPVVAGWSRIRGNSVSRTKSDSTFDHSYFGLHNHLSWKVNLSELWISESGIEFLYNFGAPEKMDKGTRLYSAVYHNYEDFMEIKFTGEIFANQSDSAIAYYNSEIYGHNNRQGFLTQVQSHFYNSGLTAGVSFTNSWPIDDTVEGQIGYAMSFAVFLMTNYIAI